MYQNKSAKTKNPQILQTAVCSYQQLVNEYFFYVNYSLQLLTGCEHK